MPRLNIWPLRRMVDKVAAATPSNRFSTELIIALVLGEENKEKPYPSSIRLARINHKAVLASRKNSNSRPAAVNPMPAEASTCGSILSERRPVRGEKMACITGMVTSISPASRGSSPLIYCR